MLNKRVLIITYYWPPAGGPGVQRVLKFAKYLPQFGWEPIILTVKDGEYQAIDKSLESDISETLKVFKTRAIGLYGLFKKFTGRKTIPTHQLSGGKNDSLFSRLSRWVRLNIILPDGRIGWYPFAVVGGRKIIENEKVDLIFSSGPPHSLHLIARSLAKKYSISWVADFRDPWTERFYYMENKRSRLASFIELKMEMAVLKKANVITAASEGFTKLLLSKTGEFEKGVVITNGFDPEDFPESSVFNNDTAIIILHIGNLAKSQIPFPLLRALKLYQSEQVPSKYKLKLIGSIHLDIIQAVTRYQLDEIVEYGSYLEHELAVREMQQADCVFTVVPDTANNSGIIPGKLFEYIKSGTPTILIGPPDCDAAKIIRLTKSGYVFNYDSDVDLFELIGEHRTFKAQNFEQFSRAVITEKLSNIFNNLL